MSAVARLYERAAAFELARELAQVYEGAALTEIEVGSAMKQIEDAEGALTNAQRRAFVGHRLGRPRVRPRRP
jgi:hypothetical protein